ncbi:MAG TPA: hypothetical protein VIG62_05760 [Blastocatellia bacterium]|jgi:uncharacterized protein YxjI
MNFPLQFTFKILALATQLSVTDSTGRLVFYVKQKMFKLKESITIFADQEQTHPLYTINADRMLDISATYNFADRNGANLGAISRQGMKSIWRARYDIRGGDAGGMTIQEANPWTKVLDGLLGAIPIIGMLAGYFFHPVYEVRRVDGTPVVRMKKEPAFFEGKYSIERLAPVSDREETHIVLSLIMVVLLERSRG